MLTVSPNTPGAASVTNAMLASGSSTGGASKVVLTDALGNIYPGSGAISRVAPDAYFVYDGDSNMLYPADGETSFPDVLALYPPFTGHSYTNAAGSGQRVSDVQLRYAAQVYTHRPAAQGVAQVFYCPMVGTNNCRPYNQPTSITGATITSGSAAITLASPNTLLAPRIVLTGNDTRITPGTTILSVTDSTHFTMSANAIASGSSQTITAAYPYTAAQIMAELETLWAQAKADGFTVVAFTIPPSYDCQNGYLAYGLQVTNNTATRSPLNDLIRRSTTYDILVDLAALWDSQIYSPDFLGWKEQAWNTYLHFNLKGRTLNARAMTAAFCSPRAAMPWYQPTLENLTNSQMSLGPYGGQSDLQLGGPVSSVVTSADVRVHGAASNATVTVGRLSSSPGDHTRFRVEDRLGNVVFEVNPRNGVYSWTPNNGVAIALTNDVTITSGDASILTIGKTLKVKSGTNAKAGTFTLTAGAATIANTSITANSVIQMTLKTAGGTLAGQPYVDTITPGTGFTVAGGGALNTSTYNFITTEVN